MGFPATFFFLGGGALISPLLGQSLIMNDFFYFGCEKKGIYQQSFLEL